jgi:hypothetical protein
MAVYGSNGALVMTNTISRVFVASLSSHPLNGMGLPAPLLKPIGVPNLQRLEARQLL